MPVPQLDNLVRIGKLKHEAPAEEELAGLKRSARARLSDAGRTELSFASRFDLAYNAAHALALYCLRRAGYRASSRFMAFQTLAHTSSLTAPQWRVLAKAHEHRNLAEYEGHMEVDTPLLEALLNAAGTLLEEIDADGGKRNADGRE